MRSLCVRLHPIIVIVTAEPGALCVPKTSSGIDLVTETHNVGHDGRADISLLELGCLALQVQEPT